jgi:hypothetical protein
LKGTFANAPFPLRKTTTFLSLYFLIEIIFSNSLIKELN